MCVLPVDVGAKREPREMGTSVELRAELANEDRENRRLLGRGPRAYERELSHGRTSTDWRERPKNADEVTGFATRE